MIVQLLCLLLIQLLLFDKVFCEISTNNNGYYIGVYDDTNTYNWFDAKTYCMTNYGSSLASVHSSTDETNLKDARVDTSKIAWTGLNDINEESIAIDYTLNATWEWSDGTPYDYVVSWAANEPSNSNGGQDCGQIYSWPAGTWDDEKCNDTLSQFICNLTVNWRAIMKISNNNSNYDGQANSYYWYLDGSATYDDYYDDLTYLYNTFNASQKDSDFNYRSLIIDDWSYLYNNSAFDKVKLSIYKNGIEVRYFVFEATNDSVSWMSQNNLIESSYLDAKYETYNKWGVWGAATRHFMIWHNYGGCTVDAGWIALSEPSKINCSTVWSPGEMSTGEPEIRYSTKTSSTNGLLIYGKPYVSSENAIGDTLVVYLNPDNSDTFGKEFASPSPTGQYINVYTPYESWNWFEAKDYCMNNFGSSLASVHSTDDETELKLARRDTTVSTWVGFNDINEETISKNTTWQWTDGTLFNYEISWATEEPDNNNNNENCGMYYSEDNGANDYGCTQELPQFICNEEDNWRPLFKINGNVSDYNGANNLSDFWFNSEASMFTSHSDDIEYILDTFNASVWNDENYRSINIDDWQRYYSYGKFDKIKISIYKNGTQVKYFVYNASYDIGSWFSQDNLIDSSYYDTKYKTADTWDIESETYERYWIAFEFEAASLNESCAYDAGWIAITQDNACEEWRPMEGNNDMSPQIRYSTNYTSDGKPIAGYMDNMNENAIADTFVIFINAQDSTTFGLTDSPTQLPTYMPSDQPSKAPTNEPTNNPTKMPSNQPTFNPTKDPTKAPSDQPTYDPTRSPTNMPTDPTVSPSAAPSMMPSAAPSNAPSFSPSRVPTDLPTSVPTDYPSVVPTDVPTDAPSIHPTAGPTKIASSSSEGSSSKDETIQSLTTWLIILGILLLLVCLFCGLFILYLFRRNNGLYLHNTHSEMYGHSNNVNNANNNVNNNNNNGNTIAVANAIATSNNNNKKQEKNEDNNGNEDDDDDLDIALEMVNMPHTTNDQALNHLAPAAGNNNNNNANNNQIPRGTADGPLHIEPIGILAANGLANTAGGNNAIGGEIPEAAYSYDGLAVAAPAAAAAASGAAAPAAVNRQVSGVYVTGSRMNIDGRDLEIHGDWDKWKAKDVNTWLLGELENTGFEREIIDDFMKEFEQLHMTGKLLKTWLTQCGGNSDLLTTKLQSKIDFPTKSMVWDVIVQAIMNLDVNTFSV